MNLKVLLPVGIFDDKSNVLRIVAEPSEESLRILSNRLDCVTRPAPRILTYEADDDNEVFVAVDEGVWFGLGMMGLIGWSVAVPNLLEAALGIWLDLHYTSTHSWTLSLLIPGLLLVYVNAWRWVASEDKSMKGKPEDDHE